MLNQEWVTAIEGFLAYDRALGKRSTTNGARRQHLQHLARRVTVGPWAVTADVLLDYLGKQEWAPETRRGRRTSFDRFYRWGMYRGFVHVNPVDPVERVRVSQATARPAPDRAYHEALMRASPRERIMLRLAAEVGMRRGEVAVTHTRDLMEDLVGRSLIVHGKGGRTRIVPLPDSLGRTRACSATQRPRRRGATCSGTMPRCAWLWMSWRCKQPAARGRDSRVQRDARPAPRRHVEASCRRPRR